MAMEDLAVQIGELHRQWITGQLTDREFVNKVAQLLRSASVVN